MKTVIILVEEYKKVLIKEQETKKFSEKLSNYERLDSFTDCVMVRLKLLLTANVQSS